MKTSFITTIFNEEEGIGAFLDSILKQTILPDEVIIVDGGSIDGTIYEIERFIKAHNKAHFRLLEKKGNRSVGRNEAIKHAKGDVILISDAGCLLDKKWVEEIIKPFSDTSVDVVAGYYKGKAETVFEQCLVPYVLVMPDRVDPYAFLPATRSMAMRKKVWEELGGFPEQFSHNEDFVFAQSLRNDKKKIVFTNKAIVWWLPRNNFRDAYVMFSRFAYGDAEAGILRPKVIVLCVRYLIGIFLVIFAIMRQEKVLLLALLVILVLYCIWAVWKNYNYIKKPQALILLPLLQFTADFAVIGGTSRGLIARWGTKKTSSKVSLG